MKARQVINSPNKDGPNQDAIKRLYLEITSHCNLDCAMCTRKNWLNEGIGHIAMDLLSNVINSLDDHPALDTIFIGGIGEPLTHPHLLEIIKLCKARGKRVEMITNGTLLDKKMSMALIQSGLDMLWVSVDGAFSPCYEDIRQGATASNIYQNLAHFCEAKRELGIFDVHIYDVDEYIERKSLQLGLAFVAMKRNIKELPRLIEEARNFGVREIKVTHVIPYTPEMVGEALYDQVIRYNVGQPKTPFVMHLDMPLMDWNEQSTGPLAEVYNMHITTSHMDEMRLRKENHCPFVEKQQVFIRWDGAVCPCMALLHDSKVYWNTVERNLKFKSFGNVAEQTLKEIWEGEEYTSFRQKVREFQFSPCVTCGVCELIESNEEDCYGNEFPTCGGCLWAQGLVQCP